MDSDERSGAERIIAGGEITASEELPPTGRGAREKILTAKGHSYAIETKYKQVNCIYKELDSNFGRMLKLHNEQCDISQLTAEHAQWLSQYEEFLLLYEDYSVLIGRDTENKLEARAERLRVYKATAETWFIQRRPSRSGSGSEIGPDDSASQHSSKKGSSLNSSIASARLKGEQERAELSAKMTLLQRRHDLEMAKLNLKLEEEKLDLITQMEIVEAKSKVLNQFGSKRSDTQKSLHRGSVTSAMSKPDIKEDIALLTNRTVSGVNQGATVTRPDTENVPKTLSPTAKTFVPSSERVYHQTDNTNISRTPKVDRQTSDDRQGYEHISSPHAITESGHANRDIVVDVVRQLRKPVPDIKKFSGDPLEYPKFMRQFKTKVVNNSADVDECFNYLEQFTEGEARKVVNGFSYLDATAGYPAALNELHERYGDQDILANAFVKRALSWPNIKADNPKALDDFAIFLSECESAIYTIEAVQVLQYPENMRRLMSKLPFHYHDKWRGVVQQLKLKSEAVKFHHLAQFVKLEAKKACDPTYRREALRGEQGAAAKGLTSRYSSQKPARGSYLTQIVDANAPGSAYSSTLQPSNVKTGEFLSKVCGYCNGAHALESCRGLSKLEYNDRIDFIKSKGLCYSCLKPGHLSKVCKNRCTCATCKRRHPTVLHDPSKVKINAQPTAKVPDLQEPPQDGSDTTKQCLATGAGEGQCTMTVIPVRVQMKNGLQSVTAYAFLDPGSTVSFCTDRLLDRIGGRGKPMNITIDTMGATHKMKTVAVTGLQISDLSSTNVIDLPRVYSKQKMPISQHHIPTSEDIAAWAHLNDVTLPQVDADVDLLIGNNVPDPYKPLEVRTGPRNTPHATRSLLGWIVWNLVRNDRLSDVDKEVFAVNRAEMVALTTEEECRHLDQLIRNSVNLDFPERQVDDKREYSRDDRRFLRQVNDTICLENGHYSIGLPFKHEDTIMPNNESQALKRLESLKQKLKRDTKFHEDYNAFMTQVLEKGYAERILDEDLAGHEGGVWYIPHHGIYHPRKPGKLRVVFDCTASFGGTSLNQVLLQGPDMTNGLLGVLLRFRQEDNAIMGDIDSMFYQVRVPISDCDFLRFYWWPNGDLNVPPVPHRMLVHLFGAVSSPACASFALRRTAEDNQQKYDPEITRGVKRSFYVDDYLSSAVTENQAINIIQETTDMCSKGGFKLTKWTSNKASVLQSVPVEERSKEIKQLDLEKDKLRPDRALGVYWIMDTDSFGFKTEERIVADTRRGILSLTSSVYDPLGILAPFVLTAKRILQDLCLEKCGWDEEIPQKYLKRWKQWVLDLKLLQELQVPRCYKPANFGKVVSCELHHFADASENGYGMVSYLRLEDEEHHVQCAFVLGRARVTPLKRVTIPRLELTAASILVKQNAMLTRELDYRIGESVFWTDSMSVLRYIRNESSRFHTFVANRIDMIREATSVEQWRFVSTHENPADHASRGLAMDKLLKTPQWLNGPDFLWKSREHWPDQRGISENQLCDDPEVKRPACATAQPEIEIIDRLISHFSEWKRLVKVVGWILVAKNNLRRWVTERKALEERIQRAEPDQQIVQHRTQTETSALRLSRLAQGDKAFKGCLSTEMIGSAEKSLVKYEQQKFFKRELETLEESKDETAGVSKSSCLVKLDPFVQDGVIRVGGRLRRSTVPFQGKHPVVLPKMSAIGRLILLDSHEAVGHLGKNATLSHTRQQYWIIGANPTVKQILSKCTICKRYQSRPKLQKMADLPADRLIPDDPPFVRVGLDYFGPFEIKRGRSTVKRYGVLFTCLVSRAVHLEVAASLDTDSCIQAIRRFVARRGPVQLIRSDNGTNLVAAERELREEVDKLNSEKIQNALLKHKIKWVFNPPSASHFGGVWERIIRLVRKLMYSILHTQTVRLDDEGLHTLFCEIESILNSRPLTELPSSPNETKVLTPNHLIYLRSGETLPPGVFDQSDNYSRRRWRQIQYLADLFWRRWVKEYLPMLQERQKWTAPQRNVSIGDIVLIVDNCPRNSWSLGRVLEVFKDDKGLVRSAKLKTKLSTLVRPVTKLCPVMEGDSVD